MAEKNYEVSCRHFEDKKDCSNFLSGCAIHCHNNKNDRCIHHCGKSWQTETEAQASVLKHTHIANDALHRPVIRKL